jgi:CheY-like chemotaxis protein
MDMQMPEMDGATAVSVLREHGYTGVIIAVTANAMDNERREYLAVGCDDFIPKPVQSATFTEALRKYLGETPQLIGIANTQEQREAESSAPLVKAPTDSLEADRLTSTLARDPDIGPLLPEYLSELAAKAMEIGRALQGNDWAAITRLAHQIKGSAGAYGFPSITAAATRLERLAKTPDAQEEATAEVSELLGLCQLATNVHRQQRA